MLIVVEQDGLAIGPSIFGDIPKWKLSSSLTSMASAASNIVFDDIFTISSIDKEGKKFDRGQRRPYRQRSPFSFDTNYSLALTSPFQKQ